MFATENEAVLKLVTDEHVGNFFGLTRFAVLGASHALPRVKYI